MSHGLTDVPKRIHKKGRPFPPADAQMIACYVEQRLSIAQIAEASAQPKSRVRTRLRLAGVPLRSVREGLLLRSDRLSAPKGPRGPMSAEQRMLISEQRRRWAAEHATGQSLKHTGYWVYTTGEHKNRPVHVVKMEQRIGRRLLPDEVVHHVDGDRQNNHDDNLALMTRAAHSRLHRREEKLAGTVKQRREDGTFA